MSNKSWRTLLIIGKDEMQNKLLKRHEESDFIGSLFHARGLDKEMFGDIPA